MSHSITVNHQFWAPDENGGGDRPRKVQFWKLQQLRDLDLERGRGHTGAHIYPYTKLDRNRKKTFCGRTDGRHTRVQSKTRKKRTFFERADMPEKRYKLCKFCENRAKGYAPAGHLYSTFRSNLSKNFNFRRPTPLSLHRWGWNLVPSSMPNFTPIGATCRPCGAKNLKIGLWVN